MSFIFDQSGGNTDRWIKNPILRLMAQELRMEPGDSGGMWQERKESNMNVNPKNYDSLPLFPPPPTYMTDATTTTLKKPYIKRPNPKGPTKTTTFKPFKQRRVSPSPPPPPLLQHLAIGSCVKKVFHLQSGKRKVFTGVIQEYNSLKEKTKITFDDGSTYWFGADEMKTVEKWF